MMQSETTRQARRLARSAREAGQSLVEYAIAVALIAVASMAAIQALGGGISAVFGRILGKIAGIG